jgi:hypothetical protein
MSSGTAIAVFVTLRSYVPPHRLMTFLDLSEEVQEQLSPESPRYTALGRLVCHDIRPHRSKRGSVTRLSRRGQCHVGSVIP